MHHSTHVILGDQSSRSDPPREDPRLVYLRQLIAARAFTSLTSAEKSMLLIYIAHADHRLKLRGSASLGRRLCGFDQGVAARVRRGLLTKGFVTLIDGTLHDLVIRLTLPPDDGGGRTGAA
jgi:hypothetical protein